MKHAKGFTVVVFANDLNQENGEGEYPDLGLNTISRLATIFDEKGHLQKGVTSIVLAAGTRKDLLSLMPKSLPLMMKDWLLEHGVPESIIHTPTSDVWGTWDESVSAFEIIKEKKLSGNVIIVSHRWHIWPRLAMVWWSLTADEPFVCRSTIYCYADHEYPLWTRLSHETMATLWCMPKCFRRIMLS